MIISLLYILPAILGLGVLIFFHELGHYYMARRVGMRVEVFSIGFGSPIYSWMHDGVKWQIGWLPFGGFVKIVGQEKDDKRDPYEIPDGFYGKRPIDRIKVAFAGPFVNLVLAFLLFTVIWILGGREKNFTEFTHKLGWIDPKSELYVQGIRPGDEITSYNHSPFHGAKDHLYVPMINPGKIDVAGNKVDYTTGQKIPYEFQIESYPHPLALGSGRQTTGILNSANYIVYDRLTEEQENALPDGSPMRQSGIQYGDRIVWVDGDLIFSGAQMSYLLNDNRVLLTVVRNGKTLLLRIPRVYIQELKMDHDFKEELTDWQYEAGLNAVKLQRLYTIPYNLTNNAIVEGELKFIDKDHEKEVFPNPAFASNEAPLLPKDQIIAVDGKSVKTSPELLKQLQKHQVNVIVERNKEGSGNISWKTADVEFDRDLNMNEINQIASSIGSSQSIKQAGNYYLLNPVTPKSHFDFDLSPEKRAALDAEILEHKREIEQIEDPVKRNQLATLLKNQEEQLLLGVGVQDRKINYNPSPLAQFENVFNEIWTTLVALISGDLSPKWMSGPIGIVQVVHDNWMVSIKEALFWLGAISLNLGMLNLLPIPVLDGGTIMLSLFELVTGKRLSAKTLEKLILPFAVLLIGFFIFLTYQDLSRIFNFLRW